MSEEKTYIMLLEEAKKQRDEEIQRLNYKLQQKENIIKEVREYIEKLRNFKIKYVMFDEEEELYASENNFVKELLEILKGSDKK